MSKGTVYLDFDGTLHDTGEVYYEALLRTMKRLRALSITDAEDPSSKEDVVKYLGCTGDEMWRSFLPELDDENRKNAYLTMGEELFRGLSMPGDHLFPGVRTTLSELKNRGYTRVFLSNCSDEYMDLVREKYELEKYLDGFLCAGDFPGMSKGEIIEATEHLFPRGVAFVGDRFHDMEAARSGNLLALFATYGFGHEEEGREGIKIRTFYDILEYLP